MLRQYSLISGSVIYVDPGTYDMIDPFDVSGSLNYGLGIDQGFTVQGPTNGFAATLTPAIPGSTAVNLIQLEDANLVTINNLTLTDAGRGLYVQNSANFSASDVTITGMAEEGVADRHRLLGHAAQQSNGDEQRLGRHLHQRHHGHDQRRRCDGQRHRGAQLRRRLSHRMDSGLYVVGPVAAISGTFSDNIGWGMYLSSPGTVDVTDSTVFGNLDGIYVDGNSGTAVIGDPVLTDNAGNIVHDNTDYGIFATGSVTVAGNVVYDEAGAGSYGIEVESGATATENVVYASRIGIIADGAAAVSANLVYDNAQYGIDSIKDTGSASTFTITDNVIYSNGIGIIDQRYYADTSVLIRNNLIYANTTAAISIIGNNARVDRQQHDRSAGRRRRRHLHRQHRHAVAQQHHGARLRHRHQRRGEQRDRLRQRLQHVLSPSRSHRRDRRMGRRAASVPDRLAGGDRSPTSTASPAIR